MTCIGVLPGPVTGASRCHRVPGFVHPHAEQADCARRSLHGEPREQQCERQRNRSCNPLAARRAFVLWRDRGGVRRVQQRRELRTRCRRLPVRPRNLAMRMPQREAGMPKLCEDPPTRHEVLLGHLLLHLKAQRAAPLRRLDEQVIG
jgi:hypothetical protein